MEIVWYMFKWFSFLFINLINKWHKGWFFIFYFNVFTRYRMFTIYCCLVSYTVNLYNSFFLSVFFFQQNFEKKNVTHKIYNVIIVNFIFTVNIQIFLWNEDTCLIFFLNIFIKYTSLKHCLQILTSDFLFILRSFFFCCLESNKNIIWHKLLIQQI